MMAPNGPPGAAGKCSDSNDEEAGGVRLGKGCGALVEVIAEEEDFRGESAATMQLWGDQCLLHVGSRRRIKGSRSGC